MFLKLLLRKFRVLNLICVIAIAFLVAFFIFIHEKNELIIEKLRSFKLRSEDVEVEKKYPRADIFERKDWHDWTFIEYEASRQGPGEKGAAFKLTDPDDIELNKKLYKQQGLYALVSDRISVNRSVPDTRLPQCEGIHYLKSLPKTSVIIIYHNEYLSILLRTVHSVINRTPAELLHEILLINDASTDEDLYEPLEQYVRDNFNGRVKIVNLKERKGLIVARMEGTRRAEGEVLMFLDAHMEMNVNWQPPLLEPIAIHPKTVTTPNVDSFSSRTFEYQKCNPSTRGIFSWNFFFRWLPRLPEDEVHPERPAKLPVMLGGAFAIRRDYFLDIGGYDEGLMIWNGEHYELSLKLWLCGGTLLEVPCSRVGHVFRRHNNHHKLPGFDYVIYNFKRVAEVWLDDYKQYLYKTEPELYAKMNPGDLTKAKLVRKNLNCRPFQYYLDQVVPDMLERYPYADLGVYAQGTIKSVADPTLCVDTLRKREKHKIGLFECHENLTHPGHTQDFVLSWQRHLKTNSHYDHCFNEGSCDLSYCHFNFGNQLWFYNITTKQLVNLPTNYCLSAFVQDFSLETLPCNSENVNQRWIWGYTNVSALENWETFGIKLPHKKTNVTVEF